MTIAINQQVLVVKSTAETIASLAVLVTELGVLAAELDAAQIVAEDPAFIGTATVEHPEAQTLRDAAVALTRMDGSDV